MKFLKVILNKKQINYYNFSKKVCKILNKINKKLKEDHLQKKKIIITKTKILLNMKNFLLRPIKIKLVKICKLI